MGDIEDNKIWTDYKTCFTMVESESDFGEVLNEGNNEMLIIKRVGFINLPDKVEYPLYLKCIDDYGDTHAMLDWYPCEKEEYIKAINYKISEIEKELYNYKELLDSIGGING